MKAILLNCTLKESSQTSNTRALLDKAAKELNTLGIETEIVRAVDYTIKFGVSIDEGEGEKKRVIQRRNKLLI